MTHQKHPSQERGALVRAKEADRARAPRLARRIAVSLSTMVVSLIVVAAYTGVPNVTRAPGEILPKGHYTQVETLTGGIVKSIHVVEGQTVAAGQALVELRQPDLSWRRDALNSEYEQKQVHSDNLNALRFALAKSTEPTQETVDDMRTSQLPSAADQLELHLRSQQLKSVEIARHAETLKVLKAALDFYEERVSNKVQRMRGSLQLRNQGLMTERQYQDEEDELDALKVAANTARVDLAEARSELVRMTAELDRAKLDLLERTRIELQETKDDLRGLKVELVEIHARMDALSVVAPEAGAIQSVALPNLGEVIEPGETLFEIAPVQRGLMIEARVPSADIGHVDTNQPVTIGVDTFDPRRVGKLTGELLSLSPVPLTDEVTGEDYFRAAIRLDRAEIGIGDEARPLRSGMTVVAEIVTGEQSLLAYFLKPIDNTLGVSFRER